MAGRILVTGPTGFVGQGLIPSLVENGFDVLPVGREQVGSIDRMTDWRPYLSQGIDTVVHLAGRAHVMKEKHSNPIHAYRTVNLMGTAQLVRQASEAGVRRFVFISTAKVMGEGGTPYTHRDTPDPQDPYAVSKAEAELALKELAGAMSWTVLRPPLVYGPGVGGNFRSLLKIVHQGIPLPLGSIENTRSLISRQNLVSAITHCIDGPTGTFLPSDGQDVSTPDLVRALASAMGRPARLVPIPPGLLRLGGLVTLKSAAIDRLLGDFTVDGMVPRWSPEQSLDAGLVEAAQWYQRFIGGQAG